jgi:microcin C transport system ATP-binding protein
MTPLLTVDNLAVSFRQGGQESLAVRGVSFTLEKGETLALVGESGSGKSVTALSVLGLLNYPAAHHPSGRIVFSEEGKPARDLLNAGDAALRSVRGNAISMIFQEPMTSLNPLHTIERQIGEILSIHRGLAGAGAGSAAQGGHPRAGEAPRRLSAPALGRAAPARDDRHGAGERAGLADRG